MPPLFNQSDELSLRHLPDVSDTSFSFQIPGTVKEENLLAQDDQDFFGGVDLSPLPLNFGPSVTKENLTLSQLTPKAAVEEPPPQFLKKPISFPTLSYDDIHDTIPIQENSTTRPELPKLHAKSKPRPKIDIQSISHHDSIEGSLASVQIEAIGMRANFLREDIDGAAAMDGQSPKGIRRASLKNKQSLSHLEKQERRSLRQRQKVIEGGIVKTRRNTKMSELALHIEDAISPQQKTPGFSPTLSGDPDGDKSTANSSMSSMNFGGGAAERLVQYSQNLINSIGIFTSDGTVGAKNDQPTSLAREIESQDSKSGTAHTIIAPGDIIDDADGNKPLTLSQLSPRKRVEEKEQSRAPTPTPPANAPTSPLRPSTKRPVSVVSEIHLRKRSRGDKNTPSSAIATAPKNLNSGSTSTLRARLPARKHPERNHLSGSSSSARLVAERITKRIVSKERGNASSAHTRVGNRQPPVFNPGSRKLKDDERGATKSTSLSSSSGITTSSKLRVARPQWDDTTEPAISIPSTQGKKDSKGHDSESRAPLDATRPVAFQLHTEEREAYRGGGEHGKESAESNLHAQSQRDKKYLSSIPDFKALHAAHAAELALRKENIRPTIPLPIRWETDERVKERQKFDEMMKEKEREQERLLEVRRREQEEQEEREVRELRKKAIPKAHEVPEWYKEAPKRKYNTTSSIRR